MLIGVFYLVVVNDNAVAIDLAVSLLGVNDYVEVFVRTKDFGYNATEAFFEHTHHGSEVDIFILLKLSKGFDETCCLLLFLSHA